MIGSLWNGVSGINAFSKVLGVESNNISNVNTVGHKSDVLTFQDLMYQSNVGKGVGTQSIEKSFEQGSLKITGSDYDVAIEGKGFFILSDSSNTSFYSRAGNFNKGEDGKLQNADGLHVQGLGTTKSSVISTNTDTFFDDTHSEFIASKTINDGSKIVSINARSSDYISSALEAGVSGQGYKSKDSILSDVEALKVDYNEKLESYSLNPTATSTSSTNQQSILKYGNYSSDLTKEGDFVQVTVNGDNIMQSFDTDAVTTMNKFADKISNIQGLKSTFDSLTGNLTIDSLIPGKNVPINVPIINTTSPTITTTNATLGTGLGMVTSSRDALQSALQSANADFLNITNDVSFANESSLAVSDIDLKLDSLGLTDYGFSEFSIDDDGVVYLKQENNSFAVGKITTAYFNDPQELKAIGDNLYSSTTTSGIAIHAGEINKLSGKTLELSNSSLSDGLTNLVIYQRAFEANAKSITASDDFLKTAIQLKK